MPTPTQRAADHILGGTLAEFVASRRVEGRSWRLIARDLMEATGIDVTHETIRGWFSDETSAAEAVAS